MTMSIERQLMHSLPDDLALIAFWLLQGVTLESMLGVKMHVPRGEVVDRLRRLRKHLNFPYLWIGEYIKEQMIQEEFDAVAIQAWP
jgi:hypothetical protein